MTDDPAGGVGEFLGEMRKFQQALQSAQQAAAEDVTGTSGGGAVVIRVSSEFLFRAVEIDPSVVDRDEVELLEDLVLAALNDVSAKLARARETALTKTVEHALGGLGADAKLLTELFGHDEPDES